MSPTFLPPPPNSQQPGCDGVPTLSSTAEKLSFWEGLAKKIGGGSQIGKFPNSWFILGLDHVLFASQILEGAGKEQRRGRSLRRNDPRPRGQKVQKESRRYRIWDFSKTSRAPLGRLSPERSCDFGPEGLQRLCSSSGIFPRSLFPQLKGRSQKFLRRQLSCQGSELLDSLRPLLRRGEAGVYKVQVYPWKSKSRDGSRSAPTADNGFGELLCSERSLLSCWLHSAGYTSTFVHPYVPVSEFVRFQHCNETTMHTCGCYAAIHRVCANHAAKFRPQSWEIARKNHPCLQSCGAATQWKIGRNKCCRVKNRSKILGCSC